MATRSTIRFIEKRGGKLTPLIKIYQQCDGYIDGVGHSLADWLLHKRMINGIGIGQETEEFTNGVGCLVAKYIKDHKEETGNFYIIDPNCTNENFDYNYEIVIDDMIGITKNGIPLNELTEITVTNWDETKPIFRGSPQELLDFDESELYEEDE